MIVATGIMVTAAAGTAQLFAIALRHSVASRQQLAMSIAASQKIDEITATVAHAAAPVAAMGDVDHAVAGFSDVASESGVSFERRWSIAPLAGYGTTAVVIVIRVIPIARQAAPALELATIREAGTP